MNKTFIEVPQYTCKKCSFAWIPRVENPKLCPSCKCRDWRDYGKKPADKG
jgi:predicted Zn-ribbon and HTH transcriptional regulator